MNRWISVTLEEVFFFICNIIFPTKYFFPYSAYLEQQCESTLYLWDQRHEMIKLTETITTLYHRFGMSSRGCIDSAMTYLD